MTSRRLTDEDIANALVSDESPAPCVLQHRFWDLARGALDPEQAAEILDHTLDCSDCSLALRVAQATFEASGLAPETQSSTSPPAGVWSRLAGTVLHPAAALAYLVLLLLSFPVYRLLSPDSHVPGLQSVRVLHLSGETVLRGGEAGPEPVHVRLGAADALVLRLFPDVEELPKERDTTLTIVVFHEKAVVAEMTRRASELEDDQSLTLVLDRERLSPGATYRVEVTATTAPASPLLRQSFRLDPD